MELYKIIKEDFNEIANNYSLVIEELSENEIVIYSNDYILSFEMHSAELDLSYIERTEEGRLLQYYNFGSYIAHIAEPDTRNKVDIMRISNLEKQIKLYEITLKNKLIDLLKNDKSWIKTYENFLLYAQPRDVTEIKKIYKKLRI